MAMPVNCFLFVLGDFSVETAGDSVDYVIGFSLISGRKD